MSLKVKLFSAISAFVLMLSMLLVGVYAASQTINLKGEVNFNIEDTTLYVKDIRLQSETIENFLPGYINSTLDLNLGNIESTSGVVAIEIDMINTTETDYTATCDRVLQNANLEISGIITGSSTPIEDVATTPTISGTITLTITYTGTTSVTLDDLSLSFIEYVVPTFEVTLVVNNNPGSFCYILNGNTSNQTWLESGATTAINVNNGDTLQFYYSDGGDGSRVPDYIVSFNPEIYPSETFDGLTYSNVYTITNNVTITLQINR